MCSIKVIFFNKIKNLRNKVKYVLYLFEVKINTSKLVRIQDQGVLI